MSKVTSGPSHSRPLKKKVAGAAAGAPSGRRRASRPQRPEYAKWAITSAVIVAVGVAVYVGWAFNHPTKPWVFNTPAAQSLYLPRGHANPDVAT